MKSKYKIYITLIAIVVVTIYCLGNNSIMNSYYLSKKVVIAHSIEFPLGDKSTIVLSKEYLCYRVKIEDLPHPIKFITWDPLNSSTHIRPSIIYTEYHNGIAGNRIISGNLHQYLNGFVYQWTEEGSAEFIKIYNKQICAKAKKTNDAEMYKFLLPEDGE